MSAERVSVPCCTIASDGSVDTAETVRHVDQLEEASLECFLGLVSNDSLSSESYDSCFDDGELIVFTKYYKISFE